MRDGATAELQPKNSRRCRDRHAEGSVGSRPGSSSAKHVPVAMRFSSAPATPAAARETGGNAQGVALPATIARTMNLQPREPLSVRPRPPKLIASQRAAVRRLQACLGRPDNSPRLPPSLLANLASLIELPYPQVQAAISNGVEETTAAITSASGVKVHHLFEQGVVVYSSSREALAAACANLDRNERLGEVDLAPSLVCEIELFGDLQPLHHRQLGQELLDGIKFGSSREDVDTELGDPTCAGPHGWTFYGPFSTSGPCEPHRSVCLGLLFEEGTQWQGGGCGGNSMSKGRPSASSGLQAVRVMSLARLQWHMLCTGWRPQPPHVHRKEVDITQSLPQPSRIHRKEVDITKSLPPAPRAVRSIDCVDSELSLELARRSRYSEPSEPKKPSRLSRASDTMSNIVIQAAGHGMFVRLSEDILLKEGSENERRAYQSLTNTPLRRFAPQFFDAVAYGGHVLLYIEDLTARYSKPCVMDIKMGTRTFVESEVDSKKLRFDLLDKMCRVDPSSVTEEERKHGVTKLRYMRFREVKSSTATHGWRVEGIRRSEGGAHPDCKALSTHSQLQDALRWFLQSRSSVHMQFLELLTELRDDLERSVWFQTNEVISSSLLFIYDEIDLTSGPSADEPLNLSMPPPMLSELRGVQSSGVMSSFRTAPPGVWMIDFAKTVPVADGRRLSHRAEWEKGNQEDGYLTGLDSLLGMWADLVLDPAPTRAAAQPAAAPNESQKSFTKPALNGQSKAPEHVLR